MGGIIAAIPGATAQGLVWGVMALGVYVTYKLLDIADLTVDSSLCTGGATSAVLILMGMHPLLSLVFAVFAGMLAGLVTGFLHTRLRIPAILAGILTQLGLYSINLRIMGKSSVALLRQPVVISLGNIPMALLIGVLVAAAVVAVMYWFFGTELGCAIRATGNNRKMVRAQGVNTDTMKIIGLFLDGVHIRCAGYVSARDLVAVHQAGAHKIRHCRGQNGDLCGCLCGGLRGRRSYSQDQIYFIIDKLSGNGRAIGNLALRILHVDIFPVEARFHQRVDKTVAGGVKSHMLRQLNDADLAVGRVLAGGSNRSCRRGCCVGCSRF